MTSGNIAAAALDYAAVGLHVFPVFGITDGGCCACPRGAACERPGKHPKTRHGLKDATVNRDTIEQWWHADPGANIGIWTGASRIVVLDLDGPDAHATYGHLLADLGNPGPPWCTDGASVATGRDGGFHLWFRAPAGVELSTSSPWSAGGIDIRGGNSYVVAPPSMHASGRRYRWLDPYPADGPPELAAAWVDALTPPPPTPIAAPAIRPAEPGHATAYGRRALEGILTDLSAVREPGRNAATYTAMRRVVRLTERGHFGTADAALDEIAHLAGLLGLDDREVDGIRQRATAGPARTQVAA